VIHNKLMYVFGGRTNGKGERNFLNDVWYYNFEASLWRQLDTQGDQIAERWNHAGVLYDGKLWTFGGQTKSGYSNDLFTLDLDSGVWKKVVTVGIQPGGRHGHTCSVWRDKMVLFGGRDGFKPAHFGNDLWLFDFALCSWLHIPTKNAPSGRYYHSACVKDDTLVVFGGYFWDGREHYFSDFFQFHLGAISQEQVMHWECLNKSSKKVAARNRSCLATLKSKEDSFLVLFWGNSFDGRKDTFYDDIYIWSEKEKEWEVRDLANLPKRSHASCCEWEGKLCVFGGEKSRERYNEILLIHFA